MTDDQGAMRENVSTIPVRRLIQERSENPFIIYLAHNMPHVPIFPSNEFVGRSAGGRYGDVIEELDWSVGAFHSKKKPKKQNEI